MEYFIIGIVVIVVVLGVVLFLKLKQDNQLSEEKFNRNYTNKNIEKNTIESEMEGLTIQSEELPMNAISNTSKLMEITESTALARVNNIITGAFHSGNAGRNAVNGMDASKQVLYRVITSKGAELVPSKEFPGAVRGIVKSAGKIKEHANLVEFKQKANVISNATSSAMGVVAMVVGQYYMTEINTKLGKISEDTTKISEFQDNEYRSKVGALVAQVQKSAKFQVEILGNYELRHGEIHNLSQCEKECAQLLGQASLTLVGFTTKTDVKYVEYENQIKDVQKWYVYQNILMEIMVSIAELQHALYLGKVSREQCGALLPKYSKQVKETNEKLRLWHNMQCEKFVINIVESSRKREGFDGVIHALPGLINEEKKYRSVSDDVVNIIEAQSKGFDAPEKLTSRDLFQEDVKIISKDGKLYYFSEEDEK